MSEEKLHDEKYYVSELLAISDKVFFLNFKELSEVTGVPEKYIIKARNGEDIPEIMQYRIMNFADHITRYHEVLFRNKKRVVINVK